MPSALVTVNAGAATSPVVGLTVVFNAAAIGLSCSTFTASASSVPLAMLEALLPPLSRPFLVRETGAFAAPLAIVSPLPFNSLTPTVTLLNSTSSEVATVMFFPSRVTLMFLPSLNVTVSPAATFSAVSPLACRFQPFSAVSLTDLIASLTVVLPVSPMSVTVTVPFWLVEPVPKTFARLSCAAFTCSSVAAWPLAAKSVPPNVLLVSPLTVPFVPSIITGLPPAAFLPTVTVLARLKSISLLPTVVTIFLSLLV
ncbi:Uncharacterised protein [Neisseria sicca]|nr:Uncharacterised protein [Neisseria sicca]